MRMSIAKVGHVRNSTLALLKLLKSIDCFKCSSLAVAPRSDPHSEYPYRQARTVTEHIG